MARLFRALKVELDKLLTIECNNLITIRLLVKEAVKLQTKFRYIDIHFHWLRQEVLNRQMFTQFVDMLGLSDQRGRLEAIRR